MVATDLNITSLAHESLVDFNKQRPYGQPHKCPSCGDQVGSDTISVNLHAASCKYLRRDVLEDTTT